MITQEEYREWLRIANEATAAGNPYWCPICRSFITWPFSDGHYHDPPIHRWWRFETANTGWVIHTRSKGGLVDISRAGDNAHYWIGPFGVHIFRERSQWYKGAVFNRVKFDFDLHWDERWEAVG